MLLELGVVPFGPVLYQKVPFGTIWACFVPKGPIWYPRLGYNLKRRYPHSWRDTLPGVIPMGAIPLGVATQSAAGTPSTADYYGKKNIYI